MFIEKTATFGNLAYSLRSLRGCLCIHPVLKLKLTKMRKFLTLLLLTFSLYSFAQDATVRGQLQDAEGAAVLFANVILYNSADSSIAKVETTDESGVFNIRGIQAGNYFLSATFVGSKDFRKENITLNANQQLDLGVLTMESAAVDLEEATVTASRVMVEVKPDRTVFNVDGTINSAGSDAFNLLRKAPGVLVDNNNGITVLGRSGVLVYQDGKRLPITGEELANYLQNIPAEQIDRIDIITNPGAKYEAEGNAGIIDIRLKKAENQGANGTINGSFSQGRYGRGNIGASGNYRNKWMNLFATAGYYNGEGWNRMRFRSFQNGLFLNENVEMTHAYRGYNARLGADFFVSDKHTIGFLVNSNDGVNSNANDGRIEISQVDDIFAIDSILVSENSADGTNQQQTFNLNYRYDNKDGMVLNVDADYGIYSRTSQRLQPNLYYDPTETFLLSEVINAFDTPTDISIATFKVDFEEEVWGGKLGLGTKLSRVLSDNTFLFFDVIEGNQVQNDFRSNQFEYEENVYAGYINYARPIGEKWNFSAGLRAEQTDATGNLQAFIPELMEPPVELNYLNFFPNVGLTWQLSQKQTLALNYGRRINRPDYNVLNPFRNQLSQLSYEKGNPFLRPEIVNNVELGYTLAWRYNFKLAYSKTLDQITRLIGPDETDPRAGFITWDNLAEQTIWSFNISAPTQLAKWWSAYFNVNASYTDNQADYGDGAVVDVQAFSYNIYSQQTFDLFWKLKGEISGWFSGPGVWGGVFLYEPQWALNLGLQRKFFNDQMNVRLTADDIFFSSGWYGTSTFNGLQSIGNGNWDSRRVSLSISYNFGNQKVKSRKRKTGLEDEAGRIGGDN